ncbi:hypothetical protein BW70_18405 [Escherichia coli O174:H8 str. 04-3038]|nr:hypothetical protein BW70_18405 [Escherichia coli O174:H8 str. 04-3038]
MVPLSFLSKDPRHWRVFLTPPLAGFFMPEKRHRALNALVVANTGLFSLLAFLTRVIGVSR